MRIHSRRPNAWKRLHITIHSESGSHSEPVRWNGDRNPKMVKLSHEDIHSDRTERFHQLFIPNSRITAMNKGNQHNSLCNCDFSALKIELRRTSL